MVVCAWQKSLARRKAFYENTVTFPNRIHKKRRRKNFHIWKILEINESETFWAIGNILQNEFLAFDFCAFVRSIFCLNCWNGESSIQCSSRVLTPETTTLFAHKMGWVKMKRVLWEHREHLWLRKSVGKSASKFGTSLFRTSTRSANFHK